MLAPLARRIAVARPVATALQSRPFGASSPNNSEPNAAHRDLAEFKRVNGAELFSDLLDPAGRAEIGKIRDIEDEMLNTVSAESEPIDWAAWKKEIQHPTIVDELKVMHDETPVVTGEAEKTRMQKVVEETFNPMLAELEKLTAEAEAEAAEYEKRAEEVAYLHDNINSLTVDEFLEKYPTVKQSIEKDIQEGKWFLEESE